MKKFIKSQIDSYHKKTYKKIDLLKKYKIHVEIPSLFLIIIKNNKLIYDKTIFEGFHTYYEEGLNRKKKIIYILEKLLEKYKIQDTGLIINYADGYNWKNNLPIFNFAVPIDSQGLIFPNFDIFNFEIERKEYNFNEMKNKIEKYYIKKNEDDIFFRGAMTSKNKTKIREKLLYEKLPFNVKLNQPEFIGNFKKHKYLLDLPGVKPWSVRIKYLFIMNSVVFRISFYNSKNGEKGYFQQCTEYLFKENKDYVHLIYDFDYDKEIPQNIYKKVISDIKNKYNFYEKNNTKYKKMASDMKKASKKLNLDEMLKYLHTLIETYTSKLLI